MYKKIALTLFTLFIAFTVYLSFGGQAFASCECLQSPMPAGTWYDSVGAKIPADAFGFWKSTPLASPEEPKCPIAATCDAAGCTGYAEGKNCPVCVDKQCNVYTQGYVKTWFRVPTLGELIGNALRLIFFIAGLYALVLLLLGGFEWVSSGGDDKKLTSARGKIINAIVGLVVMVAVLTLVILLEQVVFGGKVCLGISCPINMGDLAIIK